MRPFFCIALYCHIAPFLSIPLINHTLHITFTQSTFTQSSQESHDDASAAAPLSHVPTPLPPYLTAATARQHLQATAAVANSVSTTTPHTALIIPPTTTTTVAAVASVTAHSMHAAESLAAWMAARTTLDVQAAFIVFCRAIALLKAHHVQRTTLGRLRPSQLCFASNGSLQLMPAGKAVTPVCEQVCGREG